MFFMLSQSFFLSAVSLPLSASLSLSLPPSHSLCLWHCLSLTLSLCLPLTNTQILPSKIPNQNPYAVVEMGGASSQVSQLAPTQDDANAIPQEYRFSFDIEGDMQCSCIDSQSIISYDSHPSRIE